ncbi:Ca(2+)-dependent cysteine protease [Ceratobasidium sp. 394]|nr:Ca(2+)-dependent cysteine protease [Ceratobasidium sp. 394]
MPPGAETRSSASQNPVSAPLIADLEIHPEVYEYVKMAIEGWIRPPNNIDNSLPVSKRALIVAPLYEGHIEPHTKWAMLKSTATDAMLMHQMLVQYGYERHNIRVLSDICGEFGDLADPTRHNILSGLEWLTSNTRPGDYRFFHFSGHGERIVQEEDNGQAKQARRVITDNSARRPGALPDTERDSTIGATVDRITEQTILVEELAFYNEAIVTRYRERRRGDTGPCSRIMDHELNRKLSDLHPGSTLTCVLDCCASGRLLNNNVKAQGGGFRGRADRPVRLPPPAYVNSSSENNREMLENEEEKDEPMPLWENGHHNDRPTVAPLPGGFQTPWRQTQLPPVPPASLGRPSYIKMTERIPIKERKMDGIRAKTFVWTGCHQRQDAWGHDDRQPYGWGIFSKAFTQAFETHLSSLVGTSENERELDYNTLFIEISNSVLEETKKLGTLQFVQLWTSFQDVDENQVGELLQEVLRQPVVI